MSDLDEDFYNRADAHIHLSNDQMKEGVPRGKVSASNMYATARFNAWTSACGWDDAEAFKASKEETVAYFVDQYRKMLEHNFDDYAGNFERYMGGVEDGDASSVRRDGRVESSDRSS